MLDETDASAPPPTTNPLDMRGMNLENHDFTERNLTGAQFQRALLHGANFRGADLTFAQFCDSEGSADEIGKSCAKGISSDMFSGAVLEGAVLPSDSKVFPQIAQLVDASKDSAKLLFTLCAACLFCLFTTAIFTDAALITNSGLTSSIPGIGLSLPVIPFVVAAPFLLLGFQIYYLLSLNHYEELIASLPAMFQDGMLLEHKVYPWIFSSLSSMFRLRKSDRKTVTLLNCFVSLIFAYVMVPFTIWIIWFRALAGHSYYVYTTLFALALSISLSCIQFLLARAKLKYGLRGKPGVRRSLPIWSLVCFLIIITLFAIGVHFTNQATWGEVVTFPNESPAFGPSKAETLGHQLLEQVGYFQALRLNNAEVSKKPVSWSGKESAQEEELDAVSGYDLSYSNLRFIRARGAFMPKSLFYASDLYNARLAWSDLRGANLAWAILDSADLTRSRLSSRWHKTRLDSAYLRNSTLSFATLEGAVVDLADFTGARFDGANIDGVDFSRSTIKPEQVLQASVLGFETFFPGSFEADVCRSDKDVLFETIKLSDGSRSEWRGLLTPGQDDPTEYIRFRDVLEHTRKCSLSESREITNGDNSSP